MQGGSGKFFRHHSIATAYTRESSRLGITMELDGTFPCASDFVDGMRYFGIPNICLVSGIEEDERIVLQSIVHPLAKLLLGEHRTRWIVRIANVDDIHSPVGQGRYEIVFRSARQIHHIRPSTIIVLPSRTSNHGIRVKIDGIDGVGHSHGIVPTNQFLNVARVALGTIIDENLVHIEMNASRQEVVLQNSLAQKVVTLFWAIATESLNGRHLVSGTMQCLYHCWTERLRDITNAETDEICLPACRAKHIHSLRNVGKQVVPWQFQKMFVN